MSTAILAKDVYSKGYNAVKENDTLSRCLEAFENGKPPVLAVLKILQSMYQNRTAPRKPGG